MLDHTREVAVSERDRISYGRFFFRRLFVRLAAGMNFIGAFCLFWNYRDTSSTVITGCAMLTAGAGLCGLDLLCQEVARLVDKFVGREVTIKY